MTRRQPPYEMFLFSATNIQYFGTQKNKKKLCYNNTICNITKTSNKKVPT